VDLSEEDVREILRIIDQSEVEELRIEVSGFSLHVRKTATSPPAGGDRADARSPAAAPGGAAQIVEAPMLGTFYRSEAPGEPPLVAVGDHLEPDSVVCLIEVMKLMNHVQAGVSGTVADVLAEDGALVEFGQPLFAVTADA
jgi:acetyl-CoA carboxylase biotin carboxyl carrier protein